MISSQLGEGSGGGGGEREECTHIVHGGRPSHPYDAATDHVWFSVTMQTSRAPSEAL